jgi:hypothetical protein
VDGSLVAINYDAFYTTVEPAIQLSAAHGGWKVKALHDVSIDRKRWLWSTEKTRTPGIKARERERA